MLRLLVTVTRHATASPPTLSVPLHWLTDGAEAPEAIEFNGPTVITNSDPIIATSMRASFFDRVAFIIARPLACMCSFEVARIAIDPLGQIAY
jgi:hypothetical protein